MCRHSHDRAGAVAHHDIVGNVDRDLLAVQRVDAGQAVDLHTGLVLDQLRALELSLFRTLRLVCIQLRDVSDLIAVLFNQRMLRRHDHESHAVERIRAGGINPELFILLLDLEIDKCARGLADPVLLLELDVRQIINGFQTLKQLVGILRNAEIPDLFCLLDDVAVADVALAALGILIGQNDLAGRAVIDKGLIAEHKPVLEHLEEDPLRPFVVALLGGIDHARPVKRKADAL